MVIKEVLFVDGPAYPLNRTPLNLTLYVAGMHRSAWVLQGGISKNLNLARFRIHFHVHYVDGESRAFTAPVASGPAHHRPTGVVLLSGQIFDG